MDDGKPWDGIIPAWALEFRPSEWPGLKPWEQWDAWWEAAREWADKHMPRGFDELIPAMTEAPSRPWNEADI
ncbi:hypothetical protein [Arthrobacter sp. UYEF21]|uniref:hypothetical protein n=1 Tax=Arthrobacter sp. UYEF21 TaxID=1756364 RepID=UPI003396F715